MKLKLFKGLFGVDNSGRMVTTPNGNVTISVPSFLGFKIQAFLNKFAYVGMQGTYKAFWIK